MWLPKPLYEALPVIYMAVGVLFLLGAGYLGISHPASVPYAGIGFACFLSGVFVRLRRYEARRQNPPAMASNERRKDG